MILIAGGTGRLGSAAARRLLADGRSVRILTRSAANADALRQRGSQVVIGDVRDRASVDEACRGTSAVIASVQALTGTHGNTPETVDGAGIGNLIDAARSGEAGHFVLMSASGAGPNHPFSFFRIKYHAEEYLKASGLRYTIVRAPAFMEFWADLLGRSIVDKGEATVFGGGTNRVNFVSVEDVARFVVLALHEPRLRNRLIEVGGSENLTFDEVVATFERVLGQPVRTKHVALVLMKAMRIALAPFNPTLSRQIHAGIIMDTTDQTVDSSLLLAEFPMVRRRMEDFVRANYLNLTPTARTTQVTLRNAKSK